MRSIRRLLGLIRQEQDAQQRVEQQALIAPGEVIVAADYGAIQDNYIGADQARPNQRCVLINDKVEIAATFFTRFGIDTAITYAGYTMFTNVFTNAGGPWGYIPVFGFAAASAVEAGLYRAKQTYPAVPALPANKHTIVRIVVDGVDTAFASGVFITGLASAITTKATQPEMPNNMMSNISAASPSMMTPAPSDSGDASENPYALAEAIMGTVAGLAVAGVKVGLDIAHHVKEQPGRALERWRSVMSFIGSAAAAAGAIEFGTYLLEELQELDIEIPPGANIATQAVYGVLVATALAIAEKRHNPLAEHLIDKLAIQLILFPTVMTILAYDIYTSSEKGNAISDAFTEGAPIAALLLGVALYSLDTLFAIEREKQRKQAARAQAVNAIHEVVNDIVDDIHRVDEPDLEAGEVDYAPLAAREEVEEVEENSRREVVEAAAVSSDDEASEESVAESEGGYEIGKPLPAKPNLPAEMSPPSAPPPLDTTEKTEPEESTQLRRSK